MSPQVVKERAVAVAPFVASDTPQALANVPPLFARLAVKGILQASDNSEKKPDTRDLSIVQTLGLIKPSTFVRGFRIQSRRALRIGPRAPGAVGFTFLRSTPPELLQETVDSELKYIL